MIIIFDTETTGLPNAEGAPLSTQPHVIEFAAVKLNDDLTENSRLEFLCDPKIELSDRITQITGLKNDDVRGKPSFVSHLQQLTDFFLGCKTMVAHNLPFDRNMIKFELQRIDKLLQFPWPPEHICTVEKTFHFHGYRLNLNKLHQELIGLPHENGAHRAMNDVDALTRCYLKLKERNII